MAERPPMPAWLPEAADALAADCEARRAPITPDAVRKWDGLSLFQFVEATMWAIEVALWERAREE